MTTVRRCKRDWRDLFSAEKGGELYVYCDRCETQVHAVQTRAAFEAAVVDGKCVWFTVLSESDEKAVVFGGPAATVFNPGLPLTWEE